MSVRSVSEQLYLKVFSTQKVNFVKSFYSGRTFAVFITLVVFFPTGWIFFCGKSKTFCQNFKIFRKNIICFLKEKKSFAFNLLVESWNYRSATPPPQPPPPNFISSKVWWVPAQIKNTFGKNFFVLPANILSRKIPTVKRSKFWRAVRDFFPQNSKNIQKFLFLHKNFSSQKAAGTL